jgi:hypothetical protein
MSEVSKDTRGQVRYRLNLNIYQEPSCLVGTAQDPDQAYPFPTTRNDGATNKTKDNKTREIDISNSQEHTIATKDELESVCSNSHLRTTPEQAAAIEAFDFLCKSGQTKIMDLSEEQMDALVKWHLIAWRNWNIEQVEYIGFGLAQEIMDFADQNSSFGSLTIRNYIVLGNLITKKVGSGWEGLWLFEQFAKEVAKV